MGAYVSLLEYGGIEGMILLSELSRRRIRSVQKLIKVGRQEPVMVLRVDKEKGYIDLSKRRVSPEDVAVSRAIGVYRDWPAERPACPAWRAPPPSPRSPAAPAAARAARPPQKCEERFAKSKLVHSIMRHVAETSGADLEALYTQVTWPLYKLYGHAHDAFRAMITDAEAEAVFKRLQDEVHGGADIPVLSASVKDGILKNVRRRLTPQPLKIRADVEMTCFNYDGVEHIKTAMRAAAACGTEECEVKVKLVAPPLYVLTTQALDKAVGVEVLTGAVDACKASIEANKGNMRVKEAARAVSEREERALQEELEAAEKANLEVAGDSGSDADEFEEGQTVDLDAGPLLAM
jgi:translation initiation factor 2 subunit 1